MSLTIGGKDGRLAMAGTPRSRTRHAYRSKRKHLRTHMSRVWVNIITSLNDYMIATLSYGDKIQVVNSQLIQKHSIANFRPNLNKDTCNHNHLKLLLYIYQPQGDGL